MSKGVKGSIRHGTRSCYDKGCRHPECVEADRTYHREYYHRWKLTPNGQQSRFKSSKRAKLTPLEMGPLEPDRPMPADAAPIGSRAAALVQTHEGDAKLGEQVLAWAQPLV